MSQDPLQSPMSSPNLSGTPVPAVAAATVAAQSVDGNHGGATSVDPAGSSPPAADAKPPAPKFTQPIVAKPDRKFFIKRMVIALAVLAGGCYFLYDGFKGYPTHNAKRAALVAQRDAAEAAKDDATRVAKEKEIRDFGNAKTDFDILLQKLIGFLMLPPAFYMLWKFLSESKGELRLENDTLFAPGHPPIPIPSLTGVANARWEKKGIAFFDYRLADGTDGRVRVDDFIFERPPTDAIHDELLAKMPKTEEV